MKEALKGAKEGSGTKTSVLMDEKGRLMPTGKAVNPLKPPVVVAAGNDPVRAENGAPVFHQAEVFKVWSRSYVDSNGNLHSDKNAWFTTQGRWAFGTLAAPGEASAVAEGLMEPAMPGTHPGRVVQAAPKAPKAAPNGAPAPLTEKERNEMALKGLASAASSVNAVNSTQRAAQGTAPGISLLD